MELCNYLMVNQAGLLIYLGIQGKWYEVIGYNYQGVFVLREL